MEWRMESQDQKAFLRLALTWDTTRPPAPSDAELVRDPLQNDEGVKKKCMTNQNLDRGPRLSTTLSPTGTGDSTFRSL
jgi:hypothetical protein